MDIFSHAVPPMDYVSLDGLLRFGACEREACTTITIVDDLVDEEEEFFHVLLERTPGLDMRISLAPIEAEIIIEDNDSEL